MSFLAHDDLTNWIAEVQRQQANAVRAHYDVTFVFGERGQYLRPVAWDAVLRLCEQYGTQVVALLMKGHLDPEDVVYPASVRWDSAARPH